jgi:hypothetical protein
VFDIDGKGVIRDNQIRLDKNKPLNCSGLEGIIVKIRSPNLPISLSGNQASGAWDQVYWWDTQLQSSAQISETSNTWCKPLALYSIGSGYSSFGSLGMRLNQQTGFKTVMQKIPDNNMSLQLELTNSTVFEIETAKANQSVSVSRPPTTLTAAEQKIWRIIHRIPGSIVVILNATNSRNTLLLDPVDFKPGQDLTPGKSRMFVVDQQGLLNPVGR